MKNFLENIVKLKKITIKDFRFGTFPSISGSGSGYTFYRPPKKGGDNSANHKIIKYKTESGHQRRYQGLIQVYDPKSICHVSLLYDHDNVMNFIVIFLITSLYNYDVT